MKGPGKKGAKPTLMVFDLDVTADALVAAVQQAAAKARGEARLRGARATHRAQNEIGPRPQARPRPRIVTALAAPQPPR